MFDEKVSILIPFKSDRAQRDRNWTWIKKRYEILMPRAEICIGETNIVPYCKAAAVNNAAKLATREIFIIADADIVFDINHMEIAIQGLSLYSWIIPYQSINRLTEKQTVNLLNQDTSISMSDINFTGCTSILGSIGGLIIVPRKYFEKIRGFDERFKGWGAEDDAFYMAMNTILGRNARLKTPIWHLSHPLASKINYEKNCDLFYKCYINKQAIIKDFKTRDII